LKRTKEYHIIYSVHARTHEGSIGMSSFESTD